MLVWSILEDFGSICNLVPLRCKSESEDLSSLRAVHARAVNHRQSPTVGPVKDYQKKRTSVLKWLNLENKKRYRDGSNASVRADLG